MDISERATEEIKRRKIEKIKALCDEHTYCIDRIKSFQKGEWMILDENEYRERLANDEVWAIVEHLKIKKREIEREIQEVILGGIEHE